MKNSTKEILISSIIMAVALIGTLVITIKVAI